MIKILITGGAGFIGTNFIQYLIYNKIKTQIYIIDNLFKGSIDFLKQEEEKIGWEKTDITDQKKMGKIFVAFKPTVVLHLAAKHYIPECEVDPGQTFKINVYGTYVIVNLCNKYKVKHLLFTSSAQFIKNLAE